MFCCGCPGLARGADAGGGGDKAGESSSEEATGKEGKGGEGKGGGDDDEATHTQNSATYRSGRAGTSARTPRTQTQTQLTARSRGGASAAEGSKVAVCSRLCARTFIVHVHVHVRVTAHACMLGVRVCGAGEHQSRAFFAQADKSLPRVRVALLQGLVSARTAGSEGRRQQQQVACGACHTLALVNSVLWVFGSGLDLQPRVSNLKVCLHAVSSACTDTHTHARARAHTHTHT